MKMPLVFDENGDVSIYWSEGDALKSIEAVDVRNNEYIAYDATGRLLSVDIRGSRTLGIRLADDPTEHVCALASALKRYVGAREACERLDALSVPDLLQIIETKRLVN